MHVVPLDEADEKPVRPYDPYAQRDNLIAFAAVASMVALLHLVSPWVPLGAIDLLLIIPVIVNATYLQMRAAIWSAIWAALAYNFFFIPPLYTLTIDNAQNIVMFAVLALVAIVVGMLAGRVRRQAQTSAGVARLNASLARFAGLMGGLSTRDDTARVACHEIGMLLDVEAMIVSLEGETIVVRGNDRFPELDLVDAAAARWTLERGEPTGRDTNTLASADWQFHPLKTTLGIMGALGVARSTKERVIRPDDATLLASLVDQTALAHERLVLEADARQVDALRERDRLRGALLGSIAHDLRTPLTAVIAATEAIPAQGEFAEEVGIARAESRRLQRFLNDLLEASRIEHGTIEPKWESLDLTDVITSVLRDLRQDRADARVVTRMEADCPLVISDALLLRHILINLIDNALKFSSPPAPVDVELACKPDGVICRVLDRGPGLPADRENLSIASTGCEAATGRAVGSGSMDCQELCRGCTRQPGQ